MNKRFSDNAWEDYIYWQMQDKKTLKRINRLLRSVESTPFDGIGKPEALRHEYRGMWSRRINDTDRLIYSVEEDTIFIFSCRGHYE